MAAKSSIRSGDDYKTLFDAKGYTQTLFNEVEGVQFTEFRLKTLYELFSTGKLNGNCLVDIGSGPCIHTVIPAAKWFNEIIVTDYSQMNRDMLEKWLKKDQEAHDWTPFFKYYSKLAGDENNWSLLEDELRPKIKRVLTCDVFLADPLSPVHLTNVDAITTSACLESACSSKSSYQTAMKNVVSLLKPGGKLILIGVLNCSHYPVGNERFQCLSLTRDEVIEAVKLCGLEILQCFDDDSCYDGESISYNGSIILLAEKKN